MISKRNPAAALLLLLVFAALTACTTSAPPQPSPSAKAPSPYLIDPRTGFQGVTAPQLNRRFERAWQEFQAGNSSTAERLFAEMKQASPSYLPATLGLAAVFLDRQDVTQASPLIDEVLDRQPQFSAASVYRAEAALAEGRLERAFDVYESVEATPGVPDVVRGRAAEVRTRFFDQLMDAAQRETDAERSIPILRRALLVRPDSAETRLTLVARLTALRRFADARREIAPLSQDAAHHRQSEEALVEIDAGEGAYQDAMRRLQDLAAQYPGAGYEKRLGTIRETWIEGNMPPQYLRAVESSAITRADLAVLLYWKITGIRFAQNLSQPPIAVDIGDVTGRDELIRALALRLLPVDPITRESDPQRVVTASAFEKLVGRMLQSRSVPCAASAAGDTVRIFDSCHLPEAPEWKSAPDGPVTGRSAATTLDELERLFTSTK